MIYGHVRDNFPYVLLTLPGRNGDVVIEFLVDTGFEGDLALPSALMEQVEATFSYHLPVRMADGSVRRRPYYEIVLEWNEEARLTQVLLLESLPLIGGALLANCLLQVELTDGGEVSVEPL